MLSASSFRSLIWISLTMVGFGLIVMAGDKEGIDEFAYRPGLRNSPGKHHLNQKQLKSVLESLSAKTGFTGLRFDLAGFLTLDDPTRFVGGSATARELVERAINGKTQIVLENHSYSATVAFASISENLVFMNMTSQARMEHRSVQIDFTDFKILIGDKKVLAAFDLGIVLLHELVHGVLNLVDKVNEAEELGDCERFVNTIRKELDLPERQQYVARSHSIQSPLGWTVHIAELQFAKTNYKNGTLKTDEYKLNWDISRVGLGLNKQPSLAPNALADKNNERKSTASVP